MEDKEIFDRVVEIIKRSLNNDNLELSLDTTAADVEEWDSFNHIQIIVSAEQEFGLKFAISDIESFSSIGDLTNLIKSKNS